MTIEEIMEVVHSATFPGYEFLVFLDGDRPVLQVEFYAPDLKTGEPSFQKGRKWFLSYHMTKSEVVSTAFKAVLTAVEHEVRETFRYKGRAIFGPHFDVDALVSFSTLAVNLDMRTGEWVK